MNNERFMVPEALFHPSDIGMHQAGAHCSLKSPHVCGGAPFCLLGLDHPPLRKQAWRRRSCALWRAAILTCTV